MNGNELLKISRKKAGYTAAQLASESQIGESTITAYERGTCVITSISVNKAIKLFQILDIDIEEYFNEFYPYKDETTEKIQEWKKDNPRTLEIYTLKKKLYFRLSQIKQRKAMSLERYELVYNQYLKVFDKLFELAGESGYITDDIYEEYILPLLFVIKSETYHTHEENIINKIKKGMFKKEYLLKDIANFCGITDKHLNRCLSGKSSFYKLSINVALKLCFVLELDFMDVFA